MASVIITAGEAWTEVYSVPFNGIVKLISGSPKAIGCIGSSVPEIDGVGFAIDRKGVDVAIMPGEKLYLRSYRGIVEVSLVTEASNKTFESFQKTAFGELSVAQPTSVTQITATYGLLDTTRPIVGPGSSATTEDNLFVAQSGTNPFGVVSLHSTRQLSYKAGQGGLVRITGLFDNSSSGNRCLAGLLTAENRMGFGYNNNEFGILLAHDGVAESQTLTITTAATGSENATITVNGIPFTVPITAGSVEHNAYEIALYLEANDPLHDFESVMSKVVCTGVLDGPEGAYSFSSGTAVAAWNQGFAGVYITDEWTPRAQWNRNTCDWLDVTKGNVYQIQFQYLGFGAIRFFIEDPESGCFILVHIIEYANKHLTPSVSNPSFRIGWASQNLGVGENVIVRGGSAAAFVEGDPTQSDDTRGIEVDATGIGTNETTILAIRNPYTFASRINRVEISILLMSLGTDTTKRAKFTVRKNPTITGDFIFSEVAPASPVQVAKDNNPVVGGKIMFSFVMTKEGIPPIDLTDKLLLLPRDIIVISASVSSGSASEMSASLNWREDF